MKIYEALAFNEFYNKIAETDMSIKVSYQLNRIANSLKNDILFYHSELERIFEDCIVKDGEGFKRSANGTQFVIKSGKEEEFKRRFSELENLEIDFDSDMRIDIDLLEEVRISPGALAAVTNFLK